MSSMSVLGVLAKSRTAPTSSPIGSEKPAAPRHRGSVPSAIVKSIRGASFRPSLVVFSSKPMTATESAPPSTITANPIYDAYKQARLEVLRMEATWQLLVTGIEVTKYPHQGAARTRVLWLSLDGRLCLGRVKGLKEAAKAIPLWYLFSMINVDDVGNIHCNWIGALTSWTEGAQRRSLTCRCRGVRQGGASKRVFLFVASMPAKTLRCKCSRPAFAM
ncbi:hypothetical protein, variant 2 [Aphanomyces astaci]|uniref:Uncharacterized protein n=1 Tax=Aphanomyces astaci TaxID=112090 RepID=W4FJ23_APHAT|nr:hypothetical protein, variant 2 [Aphanomyces astaci]ETV66733.1 hypothetical protein, variant 2 [Aphanomyces astaci]|eukprot:XP_009843708.1 hypothetical protein, variant 2 [Aphanomyces astaci]